MEDAVYSDLKREHYVTNIAETARCIEFCEYHIDHVDQYAKDVYSDPYLVMAPATAKIRYEPLGVALIIGSWNYPYFTMIKPLISCITAGNCAILKPSEHGVASSKVMMKLFQKYMDPELFQMFLGDASVAQRLNDLRFDIICFTGSTHIGKIVAERAAKNLTPCILELGGKSPMIWDKSVSFSHAAYKTVFAKFQTAGQACISVDYLLVHESQVDRAI